MLSMGIFRFALLQERRLKEEAAAQQDTNNSSSFVSLIFRIDDFCFLFGGALLIEPWDLVEMVVDVFWR